MVALAGPVYRLEESQEVPFAKGRGPLRPLRRPAIGRVRLGLVDHTHERPSGPSKPAGQEAKSQGNGSKLIEISAAQATC